MAGSSAEVLQEYLVSLGFKTDAISLRKFEDSFGKTEKRIFKVGMAVAGVVASVEAASVAFAYSMRKTYFASELANSSVKNLKSLQFAGEQVGVSGDAMAGAIHSMAQALRLNPGLSGLIESLGVPVKGRDTSDVAIDLVKALKGMPEFVGAQYAALFGIDPDTFHQMSTHLDELIAKRNQMLEMYKKSGVDPDKAKESLLAYTAAIDALEAKLGMLGQAFLIRTQPQFMKFTEFLSKEVDKWTDLLMGKDNAITAVADNTFRNMLHSWAGVSKLGRIAEVLYKYANPEESKAGATGGGTNVATGKIKYPGQGALAQTTTAEEVIASLQKQGWSKEQATGIAANLQRESSFNPTAVGDKGQAYGLAQWHPERQADFAKLFGHPIQQSTVQEQLQFLTHELRAGKEQAAGVKLAQAGSAVEAAGVLSRHYERPADTEGEARIRSMMASRLGVGSGTGGVQISQNTTINVTGSGADATGRAVAREQTRVNGDLVRNTKVAIS